jgi:hypothetical protein
VRSFWAAEASFIKAAKCDLDDIIRRELTQFG